MTYHADRALPENLLDQIADSRLAALPEALRLLTNPPYSWGRDGWP